MMHWQDKHLAPRGNSERTSGEAEKKATAKEDDRRLFNALQAGLWHARFPYQSISASQAIAALEALQSSQPPRPLDLMASGTASQPRGNDVKEKDAGSPPKATGNAKSPGDLLEHLKFTLGLNQRVVHEEHLPPRTARFAVPKSGMFPAVQRALAYRGSSRMFSHQAEAIDSVIQRRQHTVVATATASGK